MTQQKVSGKDTADKSNVTGTLMLKYPLQCWGFAVLVTIYGPLFCWDASETEKWQINKTF